MKKILPKQIICSEAELKKYQKMSEQQLVDVVIEACELKKKSKIKQSEVALSMRAHLSQVSNIERVAQPLLPKTVALYVKTVATLIKQKEKDNE